MGKQHVTFNRNEYNTLVRNHHTTESIDGYQAEVVRKVHDGGYTSRFQQHYSILRVTRPNGTDVDCSTWRTTWWTAPKFGEKLSAGNRQNEMRDTLAGIVRFDQMTDAERTAEMNSWNTF
jgi:hypothetical protein